MNDNPCSTLDYYLDNNDNIYLHPLYFFCSASIGDGGVDLFGSYNKRLLIVQCKDYTASICRRDIYAFEGVLSRYTKETTLGIFVVSKKRGYTKNAIDRVESSQYELLLTNYDDLIADLNSYIFKYHIANIEIMNCELMALKAYVFKKEEEASKKIDIRDFIIIILVILLIIVCTSNHLLIKK